MASLKKLSLLGSLFFQKITQLFEDFKKLLTYRNSTYMNIILVETSIQAILTYNINLSNVWWLLKDIQAVCSYIFELTPDQLTL